MMNGDDDGDGDTDHEYDDDSDDNDGDDGDDDEDDDIDVGDNDDEAAISGPREKRITFLLAATKSKDFSWRSAYAGTILHLNYCTSPSSQVLGFRV